MYMVCTPPGKFLNLVFLLEMKLWISSGKMLSISRAFKIICFPFYVVGACVCCVFFCNIVDQARLVMKLASFFVIFSSLFLLSAGLDHAQTQ